MEPLEGRSDRPGHGLLPEDRDVVLRAEVQARPGGGFLDQACSKLETGGSHCWGRSIVFKCRVVVK